jgi:hypothetical protein
MKTFALVVSNSYRCTDYSLFSRKSEAVESGFSLMDIKGYKVLFKWLRNPNRRMYIELIDLYIHFLDGTVISGTTDETYDHDNRKVLALGSSIDLLNEIKETIDDAKAIINNLEKITQNI